MYDCTYVYTSLTFSSVPNLSSTKMYRSAPGCSAASLASTALFLHCHDLTCTGMHCSSVQSAVLHQALLCCTPPAAMSNNTANRTDLFQGSKLVFHKYVRLCPWVLSSQSCQHCCLGFSAESCAVDALRGEGDLPMHQQQQQQQIGCV